MALYQQYTFSTWNQILIDLSAFLAANGWAIDLDAVYNTSYRRLHVHRGEAHFDLYSSGSNITGHACTGYSSGSAPNAQPGASGSKVFAGSTSGMPYMFISTAMGVYIMLTSSNTYAYLGAMWHSVPKIGSWANGFGMSGTSIGGLFGPSAYASPNGSAQIYCNGEWSAYQAVAGGLSGGNYTSDLGSNKGFSLYNAGLIPQPIPLFLGNTSDSSKKHPIGYAPGLYKANCHDVYEQGDVIIIGGDTYLAIAQYTSGTMGSITYGDFIIKLGA